MIFALYCLSAWELYLKKFGKPFAKLLFDMPKSYQSHMMILLENHIHILLALLKYPFYPLFILDNGMNSISKSVTVLTPA